MKHDASPALFLLGQVVITPNALRTLTPEQINDSLRRHAGGDWGDICPDDAAMNDEAVAIGERLLSSYGKSGNVFWIITEADRSVTTILLPEDY
jgi:hypothetical protein